MKTFKSMILSVAVVLCTFSGAVMAKGVQGSGPSPYTECGIGGVYVVKTFWTAGCLI